MAAKFTLNLPKTKFPMRVSGPMHDLSIQEAAKFGELYRWQRGRASDESFTLHDGPPYANGELHMGHARNKILKDIINRYKMMKGYRVHYRPGWDCHGLPIELKAWKDGSSIASASPLQIRGKAKQLATRTIAAHIKAFKRWGIMGDWDNPYSTMDPSYEGNQIQVFHEMYQKGCIYRGYKPVYWSPASKTALAEAELEYKEHFSKAVYVLFPISRPSDELLEAVRGEGDLLNALVWTTTPWTIVANRAICYSPNHTYSIVRLGENERGRRRRLAIVDSERLSSLAKTIESEFEHVCDVPGAALAGTKYRNLLEGDLGTEKPFLPGSHVTREVGTGLVHTAPAHGFDDYKVGLKHKLNMDCCVSGEGKYTSEVGDPLLEGLDVLSDGNKRVVSKLRSLDCIMHEDSYSHRYPYDWRSKKPVVIRSTKQWFASVDSLLDDALRALSQVDLPRGAINNLQNMLKGRSDWCISRQRVWGVPIPVFYHKETDEPLLSDDCLQHIEEVIRRQGSDSWWRLPVRELLPPSIRSLSEEYVKGTDTMDVWFDSGTSWASVLEEQGFVADVYLEGTDQFRGWFQSSLLTSVAVRGKAPYRKLLAHGFVLDTKSAKMSKSLGNVVSPDYVTEKNFNADTMRLWVASAVHTSDISIGDDILQDTSSSLYKTRVTCRYMLGNLSDFDSERDLVPYDQLSKLDKYMLHVLYAYCKDADEAFESLHLTKFSYVLHDVVHKDLSTFYFECIKDRLYCEARAGERRRATQTVLHHFLVQLVKTIAPVVPHLAEEVALHHPFEQGSVFRSGWSKCPDHWHNPKVASELRVIRSIRDISNKALALAREDKAIGSPLEAQLVVRVNDAELFDLLCNNVQQREPVEFGLEDILVVSHVALSPQGTSTAVDGCLQSGCSSDQPYVHVDEVSVLKGGGGGEKDEGGVERLVRVQVEAFPSEGHKCPRCWKRVTALEGELCGRCLTVEANACSETKDVDS